MTGYPMQWPVCGAVLSTHVYVIGIRLERWIVSGVCRKAALFHAEAVFQVPDCLVERMVHDAWCDPTGIRIKQRILPAFHQLRKRGPGNVVFVCADAQIEVRAFGRRKVR